MKQHRAKIIIFTSICAFILFFSALLLLSATQNSPKSIYIDYLETAIVDRKASVENYLHFENPIAQELALLSVSQKLYSYEILDSKKLSDSLWVFKASMVSDPHRTSQIVHNFVGYIDGQMYVMLNVDEIPSHLKESLDLSTYELTDPNIIDFSDVIY